MPNATPSIHQESTSASSATAPVTISTAPVKITNMASPCPLSSADSEACGSVGGRLMRSSRSIWRCSAAAKAGASVVGWMPSVEPTSVPSEFVAPIEGSSITRVTGSSSLEAFSHYLWENPTTRSRFHKPGCVKASGALPAAHRPIPGRQEADRAQRIAAGSTDCRLVLTLPRSPGRRLGGVEHTGPAELVVARIVRSARPGPRGLPRGSPS